MRNLQLYSIMPLDVNHVDEVCADIREQYESGVSSCALFCMTLVPEGNPVVNKAAELCRKYDIFREKLDAMGVPFHGSMLLASGLISLGYLWNRVRVQGGAYGAGFSVDRAGNVYSYSYRDPTPAKTLGADSGIPDFLRAFAASGEPLDRYVISSLNELNPLLSPREKGVQADLRLLTGYTRDKAEQIRQQVLHTTPDQLAACADWIETFARTGTVCVMAHEDALKECRGLEISEL